MDVQVALVKIDERYALDRIISDLRGGQDYSHAALILYPDDPDAQWVDVHWRWFCSDLRVIPPKNYGWAYTVHPIKDLTPERSIQILEWVEEQKGNWVFYDILGGFRILLQRPSRDTPRSFTCFEFVTRALLSAGYNLEYDPEKALGSDLMASGVILDPVREVQPNG